VLRRRLLAAVWLAPATLAPAASALAQQNTPQAFLEGIYNPYRQKDFKGQPYWEPARFFAPDLAAAIDHDMVEADKRKEPPTLDGDPFVDAQEWEITVLAISTSISGGNATGSVSFVNYGQPKSLTVSLVQTPQGWRIRDISGGSDSLRALFKLGK
jgi:hypothetical protein